MKTADLKLTQSELNYLYSLVLAKQESGEYWGKKDLFIERQDTVADKLIIANFIFEKG